MSKRLQGEQTTMLFIITVLFRIWLKLWMFILHVAL